MTLRTLLSVPLRHSLIGLLALLFLLAGLPAQAYHFPWDQGHDTTDWNDPPPPGPCQGPTCVPCNSTRSPVYIPTGHFIWSDTDLVLPGRPRLGVTRTYNSHDPRDGLFGNGWSIGCDIGLYKVIDDNSTVKYVLRAADGKRYEYVQQPDGSITSPAGRFDRVEPQTNGSVHLIALDNSRWVFRADGRLSAEIDTNGNTLSYNYELNSLLAGMADGNGRTLSFTYNSGGRISHVTDHTGRTWAYNYDSNGSLISVTDPLGGRQQYAYAAYTASGDGQTYYHLTQVTDPSGVVATQVTYSGERVASYTATQNRYTYSYNTSTKTVTKTDSLNSRWTYVYNDQGLITRETNPLNNSVSYTYDANGRELSRTDELGKVWTATYDSLGRLTSRTNPLGETTRFEYSGTNPKPVKVTTPSGRVTQIAYDDRLNPVAITDPGGGISRIERSTKGDIVAVVDALGNYTRFTYNAVGLVVTFTDPLGRVTSYEYGNLGNLTSQQNPAGEVLRSTYDALNRVVQIIGPLNQSIGLTYDAAGRLSILTDPAGGTTSYSFDSYGRLATRIAPDGRQLRYQYRADNLLAQLTLADSRTISYGYDNAKRFTQENAAGEVTSYAYSARSELTSATGPAGAISRSYDAAGRLQQETMHGKTVALTRNSEGERSQMTALGITTAYTQDVRGLLTHISNASGTYEFSYDAAGRRTQLSLPNGAVTTYGYDAASQLSSLTHNGPFTATYSYRLDAAGRITDLSGDGADWSYQYDMLGRLIQAIHGVEVFSYTHDAVGNILGDGRHYDVANRLIEDNDHFYSYDQNGNLTRKQHKASGARTVYSWNTKNQLLRYERYPNAIATTPSQVIAFTHDPLGRRASKADNGIIERYVYDGDDLIGVLNSAGNVLRSFTFGANIDEPLGMSGTGINRYFHANHLGSIMALTTEAGIVSQYDYDPYGKTQISGDLVNRFRYTAREQDAEDLYYYRSRYYDPTIQRFISEDPIGLAGGSNLYLYVNANPINAIDPIGEDALSIALTAFGTDVTFPDPTDAAWPKWAAWGGVIVAAAIITAAGIDQVNESVSTSSSSSPPGDPCKGLREQLRAHEKKLENYRRDPYAVDNKGFLGQGRDAQVIAGRIRSLEKQIENFKKLLEECERKHGTRN
jgi:RHS repeat-associated protein